jgi:hypothetical protein
MSDATRRQPIPTIPAPELRVDVSLWLAAKLGDAPVVDDILARREVGIEKYGCPLYARNGRDAMVDAYQEVLDLMVYLAQDDIEQGRKIASQNLRYAHELAMSLRAELQWRAHASRV